MLTRFFLKELRNAKDVTSGDRTWELHVGEWKAGDSLPVWRLGAVPGGAGSAGDE